MYYLIVAIGILLLVIVHYIRKPKGFLSQLQADAIDPLLDMGTARMQKFLYERTEENRQTALNSCRMIVETALGSKIPDNLHERTIFLEGIVEKMKKVRLSLVDRTLLVNIGNLLIDSGIRKGRSIDEEIPRSEVLSIKKKALRYIRYAHGKL